MKTVDLGSNINDKGGNMYKFQAGKFQFLNERDNFSEQICFKIKIFEKLKIIESKSQYFKKNMPLSKKTSVILLNVIKIQNQHL